MREVRPTIWSATQSFVGLYSGRESHRGIQGIVVPFHTAHRRNLSSLASKIVSNNKRSSPPPWRRLAEQLRDEGCESMYLDRLRCAHDPKSHVEKLEEELAEEMARALSNTAAKVAYMYAKLDMVRKDAMADEAKVGAYNEQRVACLAARHELIVHRQALGFKTNNHKSVEEHFPVPAKMAAASHTTTTTTRVASSSS